MLIDAHTLFTKLKDQNLIIFDCRFSLPGPQFDAGAGKSEFDHSHIPGAFYLDLEKDLSGKVSTISGRHPLPKGSDFLDKIQAFGVNPECNIVVYDDTAGVFAARAWWMLKYWIRHSKVTLLDGGFIAWKEQNLPVETMPNTATSTPHRYQTHSSYITSTRDIKTILQGTDTHLLIDARAHQRFTGKEEPVDPVAGHIPGAVNVPCMGNINKEKKFLSPADLKLRFATHVSKAGDNSKVIHYCGSGVTACHNIFAMELAGFNGTTLYPGSWSEWILDHTNPIKRGSLR